MARRNGERQQDWLIRRQYEIESAVATAAYAKSRELKLVHGVPLSAIEVPLPCSCPKYHFCHHHSEEEAAVERRRFNAGMAPLYLVAGGGRPNFGTVVFHNPRRQA
jgi:hypothetical protein